MMVAYASRDRPERTLIAAKLRHLLDGHMVKAHAPAVASELRAAD